LFIALVSLTDESDRGSEEQQIAWEKNGIRPYPLGLILEVIHRSRRKISVTGKPR
jgi:hypothetical protein